MNLREFRLISKILENIKILYLFKIIYLQNVFMYFKIKKHDKLNTLSLFSLLKNENNF